LNPEQIVFAAAVFAAAASIVFSGVQPQLAAIGEQVYLVFGQGDLISVIGSSDGARPSKSRRPCPARAS
jgi:hypothetical protein